MENNYQNIFRRRKTVEATWFCRGNSNNIIYIGDAPNPKDMEKIVINLDYILKVQDDLTENRKKSGGFY